MSPEQADGRPVTERCDQYSLGGVMYALLAGRPPFRAKTMPEMLQLQRFAEPEPVGRLAPDTPKQLERLIAQLLAKDPEGRFPNVLVLGRHMEAMAKALSQPIHPTPEEERHLSSGGAGADLEVDNYQTRGPEQMAESIDIEPYLPPEAKEMPSQLFDAPTLADMSSAASGNRQASSASEASGKSSEQQARKDHFTTVDDSRREPWHEPASGDRLVRGVQLALLLVALGAMVWGGWRLMRPSTADELFDQIDVTVKEQGTDDLRDIQQPLEEFCERFPDDPRIDQLAAYREELELQRIERRLKFEARLSRTADAGLIEQLYRSAVAAAQHDTQQGIERLTSLLALYDPSNITADTTTVDTNGRGADASELSEHKRLWLTLARRQLAQLQGKAAEQAAHLLPDLKERLAAADKLEATDPEAAKRMFGAIVHLYGDQPWAEQVVEQARRKLGAQKTNSN